MFKICTAFLILVMAGIGPSALSEPAGVGHTRFTPSTSNSQPSNGLSSQQISELYQVMATLIKTGEMEKYFQRFKHPNIKDMNQKASWVGWCANMAVPIANMGPGRTNSGARGVGHLEYFLNFHPGKTQLASMRSTGNRNLYASLSSPGGSRVNSYFDYPSEKVRDMWKRNDKSQSKMRVTVDSKKKALVFRDIPEGMRFVNENGEYTDEAVYEVKETTTSYGKKILIVRQQEPMNPEPIYCFFVEDRLK